MPTLAFGAPAPTRKASLRITYGRPITFPSSSLQEVITELPEAVEAHPHEMYDEADHEMRELVQRKLTNPNAQMSVEQKLGLLMHCVDMGEAAAGKAEGKAIVILVGNTGSGKSTFVNILHDCKMKQYFKRGTKTKVKRDFTTTCSRRPCTASARTRN